ncbi:MAG: GIN domain-containing protein [Parahaliea sp.]
MSRMNDTGIVWRRLGVALLACLALPLHAETRRVEGLEFDAVVVYGDVAVEISQSNSESVELLMRGDSAVLDRQPFLVEDRTLVLGRSRSHPGDDFSGIKFRLRTPALEHLESRGGGEIYVRPLRCSRLFISLAGSGTVRLYQVDAGDTVLQLGGSGDVQLAELSTDKLSVALSGSGDIQFGTLTARAIELSLQGSGGISLTTAAAGDTRTAGSRVETLAVSVIGSGDVAFDDLPVAHVSVNIVGSGDVRVGELQALEASILGSGDVIYAGAPEIREKVLIGAGELLRRR